MEGQELLGEVRNVVTVLQVVSGRSVVMEVVQIVEGIQRVMITGRVGGGSIWYRGRLGTGRNIVELADIEVADFTIVLATLQHHISFVVESDSQGDITPCSAGTPPVALYTHKHNCQKNQATCHAYKRKIIQYTYILIFFDINN